MLHVYRITIKECANLHHFQLFTSHVSGTFGFFFVCFIINNLKTNHKIETKLNLVCGRFMKIICDMQNIDNNPIINKE